MANSYTQFAFEFPVKAAAVPWIKRLLETAQEATGNDTDDEEVRTVFPGWGDFQCLGFSWEFDTAVKRGRKYPSITLFDGDGEGNPDSAAHFVQAYLKKYDPTKKVGFSFAWTSSPSRTNEFGGGAVIVTAKTMKWINTFSWLQKNLG